MMCDGMLAEENALEDGNESFWTQFGLDSPGLVVAPKQVCCGPSGWSGQGAWSGLKRPPVSSFTVLGPLG